MGIVDENDLAGANSCVIPELPYWSAWSTGVIWLDSTAC